MIYFQIPENHLQHPTHHQARVQKSLEKISVPAWFKPSPELGKITTDTPRWRRGGSRRPGWRRDSGNSGGTSRPTTPKPSSTSHDNSTCSTPCSSYNSSYTRWSTNRLNLIAGRETSFTAPSPSHSSYSIKSLNSTPSYKQPYLGWRSQDQLNTATYLNTPTQRLAVSTIRTKPLSSSSARVTPSEPDRQSKEKHDNTALHDSIKEVTAAIDDYCKTTAPSHHRRSRRQLASKGTFQGRMARVMT